MTTVEKVHLDLVQPERQLSKDDLVLLDAFIQSPAYPILCRIIRLEKTGAVARMIASENKDELIRFQGLLRGLNTIETLPKLLAEKYASKIKKE